MSTWQALGWEKLLLDLGTTTELCLPSGLNTKDKCSDLACCNLPLTWERKDAQNTMIAAWNGRYIRVEALPSIFYLLVALLALLS